ncbi:hypothetical protein PBRA_006789 [Plasmodiophora brassicae]|nr:hypothetical protein PBRA_006789 [Plasmodiophora brassicae]
MKLESILLYMDYKVLVPGTPMVSASGRTLSTATDEEVIAVDDPKICEQLGSAVFAIHVECWHTGGYLKAYWRPANVHTSFSEERAEA